MKEKRKTGLSLAIVLVTGLIVVVAVLLVLVILRLVMTMNDSMAFLSGTSVNGVDVSGLTAEEAEDKLNELAQGYELRLRFADGGEGLTGKEIELQVSEKNNLRELVREQNRQGEESSLAAERNLYSGSLFTWDDAALHQIVHTWPNLTSLAEVKTQNARLSYSEEMGKFRIKSEKVGGSVDEQLLEQKVRSCVKTLTEKLNVMDEGLYGELRTAESAEMQTALADANEKLNLNLSYRYVVEDADIDGKETIGYDQLSKWLYVDSDGVSIGVDSDKLQKYVEEMAQTYSVHTTHGNTADFVTTTGERLEVNKPARGEQVDSDALFNDIVKCVDTKTGGERTAPYDQGIEGTTDLGGSYVEVDLDGQHLWVYREGELEAQGDICSGDVATGCATPEGLYTIKDKQTDRWLNGEDYHDWVSYWMPFNGGVGLHDSTWRSEKDYGGDVYLESGSHGCINMPLELAEKVYENADVGTYVILYGGVTSTAERKQVLSGPSSYTKKDGDGAFQLEVKNSGDGELSYASSNVKVAKVKSSGKVRIVGPGKATIRVTAQATEKYRRATKDVTIIVK